MRIVMVSKAVVVGAYQRKLEELARLPDVELKVLVPPSWRDSRGETQLERAFTQGYEMVETPIALNGHFHAHFFPRLERDLSRWRPDVLHVDEEPYNLAAWQVVRWATRHHVPSLFFTWQNLNRSYPPPFCWLERYCYRHATHAIAGNQEARDVLRAKGFDKPITVIPQFGVDPVLFGGSESGFEVSSTARKQGIVVGYAGGLVPEKGVDCLLKAVAATMPHGCRSCESLLIGEVRIAGTGSASAALAELATELGIRERVCFLGRVPSVDMPDFYAGLDVLVLPSRTMPNWKEQFGRVLVEAMACGVPTIGSTSGEIPHVIGDAGLVFPENDAGALATALAGLAEDPVLRARLAQAGRERVLAHYTQERIAQATYAVYRQIV